MHRKSRGIEPDQEVDGKISVFASDAWKYEEDNRGENVFLTDTDESAEIDCIGKVHDSFIRVAPLTIFNRWNGQHWEIDPDAKYASDVESAEKGKEFRIDEANNYIYRMPWTGKASIGRLKQTEWLSTINGLIISTIFSTETSTAPMVVFPNKPE